MSCIRSQKASGNVVMSHSSLLQNDFQSLLVLPSLASGSIASISVRRHHMFCSYSWPLSATNRGSRRLVPLLQTKTRRSPNNRLDKYKRLRPRYLELSGTHSRDRANRFSQSEALDFLYLLYHFDPEGKNPLSFSR